MAQVVQPWQWPARQCSRYGPRGRTGLIRLAPTHALWTASNPTAALYSGQGRAERISGGPRSRPVLGAESTLRDHLRACFDRARREMIAVQDRETRHKHGLTARELFFRGEALFDLHVDPDYHAFTYEGRVVLRLVRHTSWEPARLRAGVLMELVWDEGGPPPVAPANSDVDPDSHCGAFFRHPRSDGRFPAWRSVNVVISHVEDQHIYVQVESFDNFLTQALTPVYAKDQGPRVSLDSDTGRLQVFLIRRSELGIYGLQIQALSRLRSQPGVRTQLDLPLLPELIRETGSAAATPPSHFFHPELDASKRAAVQHCDRHPHLSVIHGPPGTGKTTTLAAAVLSAVANGDKVLVLAPSHTACDAITMALLKYWPESRWGPSDQGALVRIGMDLRVTVRALTRYLAVNLHENGNFQTVVKNLANVRSAILSHPRGEKGLGKLLAQEKKLVQARDREFRLVQDAAIRQARIVVATNLSALRFPIFSRVWQGKFNLVCIDEAGFVPDEIVLPFLTCKARLILSGDHMQLPPIYYSLDVTKRYPVQSLFERLIKFAPQNVNFLNTQYRSNALIAQWSSQEFYHNQVLSHASVANQLLEDLPHVRSTTETSTPLLFIDTSSRQDRHETKLTDLAEDDENSSILNREEAALVDQLVRKYLSLKVDPYDIGIITPYWNQVMLLRSLIWTNKRRQKIEIRTVDGYQGREKELIIMSFVRSNAEHDVGFLRESRRVNVSITRAKRACILVGDASTLKIDPALANFISFCEDKNALLPVRDIL
ncbi:hypothetical protein TCAL_00281 [Tigriopus californicus]|uniref:AAA+ ATPase domain-containing protein n=1 Tax=Tigriopus californicus TaxID=6832 RepID=A0A553P202_TIGCA|nr:DNA-binding protein SMUBP-2-like [Tigriopus californicus]TRY71725.1 hypothetical protein TCAL_00281 [Tigriopus californicus]|eukprot:TCALIF_00281-PA protein Name:"Similar to IGHMBP2 DNA-binding protein SMUBP-2 (Mesocricetus auratus)" AED:0.19 eAED:0.19 QI:0/-1/0/1/-1/1/1/0/771